jgi:hypothetical protein
LLSQEPLQGKIRVMMEYLASILSELAVVKAKIEAAGGGGPTIELEEEWTDKDLEEQDEDEDMDEDEGSGGEDESDRAASRKRQRGAGERGVGEGMSTEGEPYNFLEHPDKFDIHINFAGGSVKVCASSRAEVFSSSVSL